MANAPAKPAVLLLGDSRSRYVFAAVAPHVCAPMSCDAVASCHAANALWRDENRQSAGAAHCSSSSSLSRLGYYVHYGVAQDPPYWKNPSHFHADSSPGIAAMLGRAPRPLSSYPTSPELMLRAVNAFTLGLPQGLPIVVVLSSLLRDLARRSAYFAEQLDDEWVAAYEHNLTAVAGSLQRALKAQSNRPHRLVLVADYGCWQNQSVRAHFCAD
eukprot:6319775-Prymnesium_polylepis.1